MRSQDHVTGVVDAIFDDEIVGWIVNHDRSKVLESVFVETDLGQQLEFKAIIFRQDIAKKFNRNEKFGFAIPLSALQIEKRARLTDRYGNLLIGGDIAIAAQPRRRTHEHCAAFLHIQKTAGTALTTALRASLPRSSVCLFYPDTAIGLDWKELNTLPEHQCKAFQLLIGHYFFGLDQFLQQPTQYYSFLREPLARVKSHYWHYRTNNIDTLNVKGEQVPLHVVVNEGLGDEFDNLQTRMISGAGSVRHGSMSDLILEMALQNIDSSFDFIGLTEKLDSHAMQLLKRLGLEPAAIARENVTNRRLMDENDEFYRLIDWQIVAERHRYDMELYRLLSERPFEERARERRTPGQSLTRRVMQQGFIDQCSQYHVVGWAMEQGVPAMLDIFVNDRKVGQLKCDLRRPELTQYNIPEGAGFFFRFPSPLAAADAVSVRFQDAAHLKNSPTHPEAIAASLGRHGFVDVCMQTHIFGWAVEYDEPATLEIFVNDRKVAQIECDLPRPELTQFNLPERSGFFFPFPAPLAATDEVSVRFRDGKQLEKSPTRPQGHTDETRHWSLDAAAPEGAPL